MILIIFKGLSSKQIKTTFLEGKRESNFKATQSKVGNHQKFNGTYSVVNFEG